MNLLPLKPPCVSSVSSATNEAITLKRSDDEAWETSSDAYPLPEERESEVHAIAVRRSEAVLLNTIEDQIIPQLLLAHGSSLISGTVPVDTSVGLLED